MFRKRKRHAAPHVDLKAGLPEEEKGKSESDAGASREEDGENEELAASTLRGVQAMRRRLLVTSSVLDDDVEQKQKTGDKKWAKLSDKDAVNEEGEESSVEARLKAEFVRRGLLTAREATGASADQGEAPHLEQARQALEEEWDSLSSKDAAGITKADPDTTCEEPIPPAAFNPFSDLEASNRERDNSVRPPLSAEEIRRLEKRFGAVEPEWKRRKTEQQANKKDGRAPKVKYGGYS
jgi:hypothetical protein